MKTQNQELASLAELGQTEALNEAEPTKEMELNTFGRTPAAKSLQLLINEIENSKERASTQAKISSYFSNYNLLIKTVSQIDNEQKSQKMFLYNLLILDIKNNFKKTVPEKIKTHAINVLVAKARDTIVRRY